MNKQSSQRDIGSGTNEPDSEDSSSAPSFEKLKLEIHVPTSKHHTIPKHQSLCVHGRSTPQVSSAPVPQNKQAPPIPLAYFDLSIAKMEDQTSLSNQSLNPGTGLEEDHKNMCGKNDEEHANELSYPKETSTEILLSSKDDEESVKLLSYPKETGTEAPLSSKNDEERINEPSYPKETGTEALLSSKNDEERINEPSYPKETGTEALLSSKNDEERVNELLYPKETCTQAPLSMPSDDQRMILAVSCRNQTPTNTGNPSAEIVGSDSSRQALGLALNNLEQSGVSHQCFSFRDQKIQVSDTIPVQDRKINRVSTTADGSYSSERMSSQRRSPWSTREGYLEPPPSYFECFGISPHKLPESSRAQGTPVPEQPKCQHVGADEGDVTVKHKPCVSTILENNHDAQCEVLLIHEQQNEFRRPEEAAVETNTDHQLLAFLSCVMFWPIGLLAIYYNNIAQSMKAEGFIQQSIFYSKRALGLSLAAIAIGTTMYLLFYMRRKVHI